MLTIEKKIEISKAAKAWISQTDPSFSQAQLAKRAGVNVSYVSQIVNGKFEMQNGKKYAMIGDAQFYRIAKAIDFRFEDEMIWEKVNNYKDIHRVLSKAQRKSLQYSIQGASGLGKTFSLERYCLLTPNAHYIKATENMTSRDLVNTIIHNLGMSDDFRGNHEKIMAIAHYVTGQKGRHLVIVDEIDRPKRQSGIIGVCKDLSDAFKGKAAFVMCGANLVNDIRKLAEKNIAGYATLKRRMCRNTFTAASLLPSEIREVLSSEGIESASVQNLLSQKCRDLDSLTDWIRDIREWQESSGKKIAHQDVYQLLEFDSDPDQSLTTFKKSA